MKTQWIYGAMIVACLTQGLHAGDRFDTRSSGISLKGGMWGSGETHTTSVRVSPWETESTVETGKFGGWLSFYNRVAPDWMLTLSLGGSGRADVSDNAWGEDDVYFDGHSAFLIGVQYFPLSGATMVNLKPYLTFEAGPYWLTQCHVEENYWGLHDVVETTTTLKPGVCGGGGMHYMMSSWFGMDLSLKYHAINLDFDHPESGWEFGIGAAFFWGTFDPE